MSFLNRLFSEPAPSLVVEFSEQGIAVARPGIAKTDIHDLPLNAIQVSPTDPNILDHTTVLSHLRQYRTAQTQRAVLLLPDFATRVSLLTFDEFPRQESERIALLKFRLRRGVPFEIDTAQIGYYVQPGRESGKQDIVAVVIAGPILEQYEAILRDCGMHPGFVGVSSLAALDLLPTTGTHLFARLLGKSLTIAVSQGGHLRLFRNIQLADLSINEVEEALFPTAAYVEDELKSRPDRLYLCGFGPSADTLSEHWAREYTTPVDILRVPVTAGVAGYLKSLEAA